MSSTVPEQAMSEANENQDYSPGTDFRSLEDVANEEHGWATLDDGSSSFYAMTSAGGVQKGSTYFLRADTDSSGKRHTVRCEKKTSPGDSTVLYESSSASWHLTKNTAIDLMTLISSLENGDEPPRGLEESYTDVSDMVIEDL